ncbi:MAG: alpha/beta hydrolase [Acidimicrobiales bacterium]|jgi:pimeloyl-ACP methyl ester carboxylesterase
MRSPRIAAHSPPGPPPVEIRHSRLVSFDGTELDVQTVGEDGPMLVLVNGLGGAIIAWRHLLAQLGQRFRILSFDYRGLYRSGPPPTKEALRIEDHYEDLRRVIDASGERSVVLIGWSMGVQVAVEYALRQPTTVDGLVLICGAPGDPFAGVFGTSLSRRAVPAICHVVEAQPALFGAIVRALASFGPSPELLRTAHVLAPGCDMSVFREMAEGFSRLDWRLYARSVRAMGSHDAWPRLGEITAPTLAIGGTRDLFTPASVAVATAAAVPGGEVEILEGASHYAPVEFPDELNQRIEQFLAERVGGRWGRSALATPRAQASN